jgi:capsular polysaccharide transport system ATP-binding protein
MIELRAVSKSYHGSHGQVKVLDQLDMVIHKGQKIGIVGRNGAGKSTLVRIVSGAEAPSQGSVERTMSVSWPIGLSGGFQGSLTGLDNFKFICRIYGKDFDAQLDFLHDFTELGRFLSEPVKNYSSGMVARLAFAASLAIDFDCYLIDEVIAVGDQAFQEKCFNELFVKRKHCAYLMVSHSPQLLETYCDTTMLLENGKLFKN